MYVTIKKLKNHQLKHQCFQNLLFHTLNPHHLSYCLKKENTESAFHKGVKGNQNLVYSERM